MLDDDHFDLEKVKDRIVEYLAVAKLRNEVSGQILCFVGPPGVGKTSLGHSIANALGRKFVRLSVGGVRDESEIRGHRRTYIGSMPGTIIRSLRDAGSANPLVLIDEIDKMGADWRGDPSSAMLEVLDPEQNRTFRDHYLDLPFDLSKTLFICTANALDTVPGPLLDRMDVIALSGYTEDEKLGIAKRYLYPKQLAAGGLRRGQLTLPDKVLRTIIRDYTREAGVRNLERRIADVCRKAATMVATGRANKVKVDDELLRDWLGPRRFAGEVRRRTSEPGVATGLAYTAAGGDILFIEATGYPGKGRLTITGQLGEVMQESAQAALSWVRAHADELGVAEDWFATHDIHIHVPAGAVPKDGPSAGVTMATALASLVRGEPVADDVGMTGETDADRAGAADRRTAREVPRGPARRVETHHLSARERVRARGAAARDTQGDRVHPGRHDRRCLRGRVRRTTRRPCPAAPGSRARSCQEPLGDGEARQELSAGIVLRRRLSPAEELELTHAAEHEGVLVDPPAGLHLVRVCANSSRGYGRRAGHGPARLLRDLPHPRRELLLDPCEQRSRVRLEQRERSDLDELRAVGRRDAPVRAIDAPTCRSLEAKTRAVERLGLLCCARTPTACENGACHEQRRVREQALGSNTKGLSEHGQYEGQGL